MREVNKIVISVILGLISIPAIAQQMEEPKSLLSPNVATLGSFREPDVALFTGTPSISIPLFEVPLQDYVLPIELQYNGTSILVDQPPSWVGLGWNLSAGGVITRKVNDVPDDHRYDEECYTPQYYDDGFYYNYSALDTCKWDTFALKMKAENSTYNSNYPYYFDSEPDEFSFSFPNYYGHFYLNHLGNWEVQCSKSVSVELIPTLFYPPFQVIGTEWRYYMKKQPACFAGFIITIEDGT